MVGSLCTGPWPDDGVDLQMARAVVSPVRHCFDFGQAGWQLGARRQPAALVPADTAQRNKGVQWNHWAVPTHLALQEAGTDLA